MDVPPLEIPPAGQWLFDLYMEMSKTVNRIRDGVSQKIPPSEMQAFLELSKTVVLPIDFEILRAMDVEFCKELQLEINAKSEQFRQEALNKKGNKKGR